MPHCRERGFTYGRGVPTGETPAKLQEWKGFLEGFVLLSPLLPVLSCLCRRLHGIARESVEGIGNGYRGFRGKNKKQCAVKNVARGRAPGDS